MTNINHICFVIPSLGIGGAERVVSIFANYLSAKNYKISVICLKRDIFYKVNKKIDLYFPSFELNRRIITLFKVVCYNRKTIKETKPDVIMSFLEFYNEITMLSLLGVKKNIYLFDRSNPYLGEQNSFQRILRMFLYPLANGVIVQTERASKFIKQRKLNNNVLVLPNPISKITNEWNPGSNKIITCVGRMEISKNHKFLIKIFSELPNDEWTLQLVGDGSLRKELEELVRTLHLEEKVKFLGIRKDVQELLSKSTIFALPSLWEGYPNSLLEAMSLGVPCISNNCNTGPSDLIVDGENGYLADIDDPTNFKNKLTLLMTNCELREKFSVQSKSLRIANSEKLIVNNLMNYLMNSISDNMINKKISKNF